MNQYGLVFSVVTKKFGLPVGYFGGGVNWLPCPTIFVMAAFLQR